MNSTTKSCSTYLSANFLQCGHCVRRTSETFGFVVVRGGSFVGERLVGELLALGLALGFGVAVVELVMVMEVVLGIVFGLLFRVGDAAADDDDVDCGGGGLLLLPWRMW